MLRRRNEDRKTAKQRFDDPWLKNIKYDNVILMQRDAAGGKAMERAIDDGRWESGNRENPKEENVVVGN
jgi:hypothetical protein